jgi:hypothetical protein
MEISKRTKELASIFSRAIRENPNDARATAASLKQLTDSETCEEILGQMENPDSELAGVLARYAIAFHRGTEKGPEDITPFDIPGMAGKIRIHF